MRRLTGEGQRYAPTPWSTMLCNLSALMRNDKMALRHKDKWRELLMWRQSGGGPGRGAASTGRLGWTGVDCLLVGRYWRGGRAVGGGALELEVGTGAGLPASGRGRVG